MSNLTVDLLDDTSIRLALDILHKLIKLETITEETSDIHMLGLSARAESVMKYGGINTISELCSMKRYEITKLPSAGKKTLSEIDEALAAIGLRLK